METHHSGLWILFYCLFLEQVLGTFVLIQKFDYYNISEQKCLALGLQTAKLETDEAFQQALELIWTTHRGATPIWIGLQYEPSDQTFRWRDGSVSSRTNWYAKYNEPDNLSNDHCVSIYHGWDNYTSFRTNPCDGKQYHIICGSYEPGEMRSDVFRDLTKSAVASGTELCYVRVKSKLACARICLETESCTHYIITKDISRCVLFSGFTSPGQTSVGLLYVKV